MSEVMNQYETEFWRRLCAPFPAQSYRSRQGGAGKTFTYVPKRVLQNRLDDVVGPANWNEDAEEGARGQIVRLTLNIPVYDAAGKITGRKPVWRCGTGGFKDAGGGMDADGVMKSAGSNAFGVACSKFGIARDLYREGMPAYIADLFGGVASGLPQSQPTTPQPVNQQQQGGYQQPQQPTQQTQQATQGGPRFDPPFGKTGKSTYAWGRGLSDYFQYDLLGTMVHFATQNNLPKYTDQWPQDFTDRALAMAVVTASRLPNYKGELDQWLPSQPTQQAPAAPTTQQNYADAVQQNIMNSPTTAPAAAPAADANAGLKQAIVAQIKALIQSKTGRAASTEELVATIGELSASTLNGSGVRGEVLPSLRSCNDKRWLSNMKAAADKMITDAAHANSMTQEEDDGLPC